jgi:DNA-binding transcriptional ArsR family regulator
MPDGSDADISKALASIQKQLSSIQKTMKSFESRIVSLEQSVERRITPEGENPLIYSRPLMHTLDTIREYEEENGHGIVAKTLTRIKDLEQPTVYDHLSKLEKADLIFWQRGTEIGLKPFNGKFYSVRNRDEALEDLPVLMALPDTVVPIAQRVLKSSGDGVSKSALLKMVTKLKESGEKPWKGFSSKELLSTLDEALFVLLRRVLIERKKTVDDDIYYPRIK